MKNSYNQYKPSLKQLWGKAGIKTKTIRQIFIDSVPETLEDDTLYISLKYNIMIHKCACGCGEEVVAKLSPEDWRFTYDGKTISVYPSIGNWNYPCESHYWINKSQIIWAGKWSDERIKRAREYELHRQEKRKG